MTLSALGSQISKSPQSGRILVQILPTWLTVSYSQQREMDRHRHANGFQVDSANKMARSKSNGNSAPSTTANLLSALVAELTAAA